MARNHNDTAKELREFIKKAQEQLGDLQDKGRNAFDNAQDHKESLEDFVKDNPLIALGGALAVGYVLGRMFKRSRRRK